MIDRTFRTELGLSMHPKSLKGAIEYEYVFNDRMFVCIRRTIERGYDARIQKLSNISAHLNFSEQKNIAEHQIIRIFEQLKPISVSYHKKLRYVLNKVLTVKSSRFAMVKKDNHLRNNFQ